MNSLLKTCRWHKVVVASLAFAGLSTLISPMALRADTAATKPEAKIPQPEVKETALDPVLATINGIPLSRESFNNTLMATGGPKLFGQLLPLVLVQDACNVAGIQITDADIKAERDRILDNIAKQYPGLKDSERDQVLNASLQRQGITSSMEFQFLLMRTASLRALAKGRATPTPKDVQEAWDTDNANKVDVFDIIVPDDKAASELKAFVSDNKKGTSEKELTDLAKSLAEFVQKKQFRGNEFSISKHTEQTNKAAKILTEAAFQLKEPSELSATTRITSDDGKTDLHVLYCVKIIPATNKKMNEEDRAKLTAQLTEMNENAFAQRLMQNLLNRARIDIKDKTLKNYYEELNKAQMKAQEDAKAAAATAPAK